MQIKVVKISEGLSEVSLIIELINNFQDLELIKFPVSTMSRHSSMFVYYEVCPTPVQFIPGIFKNRVGHGILFLVFGIEKFTVNHSSMETTMNL